MQSCEWSRSQQCGMDSPFGDSLQSLTVILRMSGLHHVRVAGYPEYVCTIRLFWLQAPGHAAQIPRSADSTGKLYGICRPAGFGLTGACNQIHAHRARDSSSDQMRSVSSRDSDVTLRDGLCGLGSTGRAAYGLCRLTVDRDGWPRGSQLRVTCVRIVIDMMLVESF